MKYMSFNSSCAYAGLANMLDWKTESIGFIRKSSWLYSEPGSRKEQSERWQAAENT